MATLSNLVVQITGNTATLNRSLDKAQGRVARFKSSAGKALKAFSGIAKGAAIGAGAALAGFAIASIKSFVDVGDELDKMSKRTGISVEALGELKFAAEQSGASLGTVEKGVKRMASTILDANNGMVSATDAFDALGISVEQLQGLSPEQQFNVMAGALAGVEDASTRAALAQDVFGRAGTELLPLFTEGADGMEALRNQAQQLGVVMSGEAAASAADFNDALNEAKSAVQGVFFQVGSKLVPAITDFVRKLIQYKPQAIAFFEGVKRAVAPFVKAFVDGIAVIFPVVKEFFGFIFRNKPVMIAALVAIGAAMVLALGPVSLAVAAVVGIIALIGVLSKNTELFKRVWEKVWNAVKAVISFVGRAIQATLNSKLGLPIRLVMEGIQALKPVWDAVWGGIRSGFNAFISPIRSIIDGILSAIRSVTSAIGGLSGAVDRVKSLASTVGNVASSVGGFLGFAGGVRNFSGGMAVVGERGPELVNLPRGSDVIPNNQLGGTTVNIIIQGDVNDAEAFYRKVNEARNQFERRGN